MRSHMSNFLERRVTHRNASGYIKKKLDIYTYVHVLLSLAANAFEWLLLAMLLSHRRHERNEKFDNKTFRADSNRCVMWQP